MAVEREAGVYPDTTHAAQETAPEHKRESGLPGGGQGRRDEVGRTGVYPASGPLPEGDAEYRGQMEWGQGLRGAAGYYDSGPSELPLKDEPEFPPPAHQSEQSATEHRAGEPGEDEQAPRKQEQ